MTPQERKLVEELFERLATLESRPREADAEQAIREGLRVAPNATYALVQTVLLQEEALRKADERIRELEGETAPPQQQGGFLDSMRDTLFGGGAQRPRGAVPQTGGDRPMGVPPGFGTGYGQPNVQPNAYGQAPMQPQAAGGGGSFLGTAAAAAVGVIGGTMLMNSMRNMMGGNHPASSQSAADLSGGSSSANASANPWGNSDASGGDLARQAGLDNMGQSGSGNRAGLLDQQDKNDPSYQTADSDYEDNSDYEDDSGDFDLGDSDFA